MKKYEHKKVIEIPILSGYITIVFTDNFQKYIDKKGINIKDDNNEALALNIEKTRNYFILLHKNCQLNDVVHEINHVKNFIFNDCLIHHDFINDEFESYFLAWLFGQVVAFKKEI